MISPSKIQATRWVVALLLTGAGAVWLLRRQETPVPSIVGRDGVRIRPEVVAQAARLEARERELNQTVWAVELLAQDCARTFETLWDSLNASTNKLDLAATFPAGEIVPGDWQLLQALPHEIKLLTSKSPGPVLNPGEWRQVIEKAQERGWRLVQMEFRHTRFDTNEAGRPRQSTFYFSAHLTNSIEPARAILEGDLVVDWAPTRSADGLWEVKRVDASRLAIKTRAGRPPFRPILAESVTPLRNSRSIDPLIVYDLDGDGLSEIILAANNLVYRRRGPDRYEQEPLCKHPPGAIDCAIVGDFDGDGAADFLCQKHEGLFLFKGSPRGTFDEPGRLVFPPEEGLKYPMALTCGDVDRDGDLDVFLAQYKLPYEGGAMPTPYHDANDGYPAYLYLNDGRGNFSDGTEFSGLGRKRWRRSYGGSLADLDGDADLDLVVVSDFAGLDVYRNDGRGHFTDVTRAWVAEPQAFGMAQVLSDFNVDGLPDLLTTGMTSGTADRLEHLRLWRPGAVEDRAMRRRMTVGNRLLLSKAAGGFEQTPLGDSIARSGWSWGCTAFDFDNDAFPDAYIANGMETKESVRDYEGEFWLHDAYVANSLEDPAALLYLKGKVARLRGHGESYGGYEKHRLFLNQRAKSFLEAGHLLGVALEQDSRNVVSDDLDGDGRMDLILIGSGPGAALTQTLRVFGNELPDRGNWIGFRFREKGNGGSPVGARVIVRWAGRASVRQIVSGDSYRSQHPNTMHFGLGEADRVETVEVHWIGGGSMTIRDPELNRYHTVHVPNPTHTKPSGPLP